MKLYQLFLSFFPLSISGDIRPIYSECNTCLARQRNGENIACPIECDTYGIGPAIPPPPPCPPCPPLSSCPPLENNCRYVQETDQCGCSFGCGQINCLDIDLPEPVVQECPLEQMGCEHRKVCPKITEITHCTEGGIEGYTTYQLSLVVQPNSNVLNVYALFGDHIGHYMYIPPAFQVDGPFNTDIGGISENIIQIVPEALYDSWITIGITDGNRENLLSTIGVDFDKWTETNGITTTNGAVFVMDPQEVLEENEYIIAQMTIPNNVRETMTVNVQGEERYGESWKEYDIQFVLDPSKITTNPIPVDCTLWYDGCNLCNVLNGVISSCTKNMCFTTETPSCRVFNSGH